MSQDKSWADLYDEVGEALAPLPDSEYDFIIRTAEAKKSSNGKPMYVIRADVESGPHAGRSVFNNFVVTRDNQDSMRIFFQQMGSFGLGKDFWRSNPSDARVAEMLVGRRFRAATKVESYQGVERNKFRAIKPAGVASGGAVPPPVPGVATAPPPPPPPQPTAYTPPPPPQAVAPAAPVAQQAPVQQPPAPAPGPAPVAPVPTQQTAPPPTQEAAPPPPPPPDPNWQPPSQQYQQQPTGATQNGHTQAPVPVGGGAPLPPPPVMEDPPFSGGF
jgi:hypothetical protein